VWCAGWEWLLPLFCFAGVPEDELGGKQAAVICVAEKKFVLFDLL
jgi:hypothetical protein